jgi:hypothetical protein
MTTSYLENCTLLVYYAVSSGNFLQTFWDNLSVPSAGVNPLSLLVIPMCAQITFFFFLILLSS